MASKEVTYLVYGPDDRIVLARNALRQREEDHYRTWLATPPDLVDGNESLESMKGEIDRLQTEVKKLEAEAK